MHTRKNPAALEAARDLFCHNSKPAKPLQLLQGASNQHYYAAILSPASKKSKDFWLIR